MGQVESSEADESGPVRDDTAAKQIKTSARRSSQAVKTGRTSSASPVISHHGHSVGGRSGEAGRRVAGQSLVSNRPDRRHYSESDSTITNQSVATSSNIPRITITGCLDAELNRTFNGKADSVKRKGENSDDMEELTITNHDSGRQSGYTQSSASGASRYASASASASRSAEAERSSYSSGNRRSSYLEQSSKASSAHSTSTSGAEKKANRRRSESSESSKSSAGSGLTKKNKKSSVQDKRKKLGLMGKNDPKGSLANKWQNIVNEFEDTYVDEKGANKKDKKDERRVSKLTMDQYDNVKQVFSKSMPLPMQMAPGPGAKVEEIEADAAGMSSMSLSTYSAVTPAKRRSMEMMTQAEERRTSVMSNSRQNTEQRSQSITHEVERVVTEETTRKIIKKKSAAAAAAATAAASASASASASAQKSHSSGSALAAMSASSRGSHSSDISKRGVKFHSKVTDLEEQARLIVDEAISAALEALGVSESSKSSKSSSKSKSSDYKSVSEKSSMAVSERRFSSEASRSVASTEEARRLEASRLSEQARMQSILASNRSKEVLATKKIAVREELSQRKEHTRPSAKSGKRSSRQLLPEETFPIARSGPLRPMAGSGKTGTPSAPNGVYDMTIENHYSQGPELQQPEMKAIDVVRTSNIRVYDENKTTNTLLYPEYIPPEVTEETEKVLISKKSVKPPTITRGTVTRVLHEHCEMAYLPTASKILSRLRAIPEEGNINTTTTEYSTNTWPLTKPVEACPENVVTRELCSDVTYNGIPSSPGTNNTDTTYNTLPAGLKLAPMNPALAPTVSNGNGNDMQPSYIIQSTKPDATSLTNSINTNMEGRYMLSPTSPRAPLYLDTNQVHMLGSIPGQIQTNVGTPVYIVSPLVSPMETMVHGDQQPFYRMYQYDNTLPVEGAAYSNEPIIVADLLDKEMPSEIGNSLEYSDNSINMNKKQTLNLYLFNQKQEDNHKPNISYVAQGVETSIGGNTDRYLDLYMNEQAPVKHLEEVRSAVAQTVLEEDDEPFGMREVTIFHKQTQTLPQEEPPKLPPRKNPPVVHRIERKQQQQQQRAVQPVVRHPRTPTPKEYHKETTHYITKERQIEKITPPSASMREFSVQTDISGTISKNKGTKLTTEWTQTLSPPASPPPLPPKQKKSSVEVTRMVSVPQVSEVREMRSRRDRSPIQNSPPPSSQGRDIPLQVRPATRENLLETIEREVQSRQPPQYEMVSSSSCQKIEEPHADSESEEEIIEMIEIEEKEQRISMAIFEELEFTCSRKEGGNVTSQSAHASSTSDLVPWAMPQQYETSVDRRKQKSTQIREITKEGSHHLQMSGTLANSRALEDDYLSNPGNKPLHQSTRHITMKQSSDSSTLPGRNITVHQTNRMSDNVQPFKRTGKFEHRSVESPNRISKMMESSNIWRCEESDSVPEMATSTIKKYQAEEQNVEHTVNGPSAATSSGYSSSDSAGGCNTRHVNGYQSPDLEKVNETQSQNSTLKRNSRYVSRFDPENIYFTIPQWTSNETMYEISKELPEGAMSPLSDESLPDSLPGGKKENIKVRKSTDHPPKLRTRVTKDKDGNLIKITEVEQTVTKTVDYTQEAAPEVDPEPDFKIYEELGGTNYMDVNLVTEEVQETIAQSSEPEVEEVVEAEEVETSKKLQPNGPEVVEETTVKLQPIEYDTQSKSLALQQEEIARITEYESQERSIGVTDDDCREVPEQKYLYDMKTATLRPIVSKDKDGQRLIQYAIGDTMVTEL